MIAFLPRGGPYAVVRRGSRCYVNCVLGTRRDVQQQTIANKKRLEEKDLRIRAKNNEALRRTAADPVAHRAYLLRASLIESVRKRAAAAA